MFYSAKFGQEGATPFSYSCPAGAHITEFSGRGETYTDSIRVHCSDGSTSPYFGGSGGGPWTTTRVPDGFTGVRGSAGSYVGQLKFVRADGTQVAGGGYMGAPRFPEFACPGGMRLRGIAGSGRNYVTSIQFGCDKIGEKTTEQEIAAQQPPAPPAVITPVAEITPNPPVVESPKESTPNAPARDAPADEESGLSATAIVIIVFGILLLIACGVFIAIMIRRRNARLSPAPSQQ